MTSVRYGLAGLLAMSALFLFCTLGAARGPAPAGNPMPAAPKARSPIVLNPHLRGAATPSAKPAASPAAAGGARSVPAQGGTSLLTARRYGGGRGDVQRRNAMRRGPATIRGEVRNAAGRPVANARVVLRQPGGGMIPNVAARHITFTGPNGNFVMNNVRPRAYRIVAGRNRARGFVRRLVHPGTVETVTIKF
jgi:hypothetical protein